MHAENPEAKYAMIWIHHVVDIQTYGLCEQPYCSNGIKKTHCVNFKIARKAKDEDICNASNNSDSGIVRLFGL